MNSFVVHAQQPPKVSPQTGRTDQEMAMHPYSNWFATERIQGFLLRRQQAIGTMTDTCFATCEQSTSAVVGVAPQKGVAANASRVPCMQTRQGGSHRRVQVGKLTRQ